MSKLNNLIEECEENINFYTNHLNDLRRKINLIEENKNLIIEFDQQADLSDLDEIEQFNNYNGYVTIALLDLSVNLKNLINSKTDWEKAFFIKNSFLTIHEATKNIKPFKGKSFIHKVIENKYQGLNNELNDLYKDIDDFREAPTYDKIKETRNSTAGHIDDSLKSYYDTIIKLDGEEAGKLISIFIKILHKTLNLTKNLVTVSYNQEVEKHKNLNSMIESRLKQLKEMLEK